MRRLHADWQARRRGGKLPARGDFDPADLSYVPGYLSLFDVQRDPLRFVFRLHASNNAQRLGLDLTGKELAAVPNPGLAERIRAQFELAVATRAPVAQLRTGDFADGAWLYEVLVLPLAADGETVDMLMSALVWNGR